jgi:hypothetical protein
MRAVLRQLWYVRLCAATALIAALAGPVWSQADINVAVSLDRQTIAADEQAVLQIEISGSVQDLPSPTLPDLQKFEVYSQGRSSNISVINGQVSSSVTYRYILIPQQPGTYPIAGFRFNTTESCLREIPSHSR